MTELYRRHPESAVIHEQLIADLVSHGTIKSLDVQKAFRQVPWHSFAPTYPHITGIDYPDLIRSEQKEVASLSSGLTTMASMLEQLQLTSGMQVLEIGTGSGYNAAILSHIVGSRGTVVTIEIDEKIAKQAELHLDDAGHEQVKVLHRDGLYGWAGQAPYDRIEITTGAQDISSRWIDQLKEEGILVAPIWLRGFQISVAFQKHGNELRSLSLSPCMFMPMRGHWQRSEGWYAINDSAQSPPQMTIALDWKKQLNITKLSQLFNGSPKQRDLVRPISSIFPSQDYLSGFFICLTRDPGAFIVFSHSQDRPFRGMGYTVIDLEKMNATILPESPHGKFITYGEGPTYDKTLEILDLWDRLGQPSLKRLRIKICLEVPTERPPGSWIISKQSDYKWLLYWDSVT